MSAQHWWRAAFVALALLVTWQTLTPDPDETEGSMVIARLIAELIFHSTQMADKVAHFMAYAALGTTAAMGRLRVVGLRYPVISAIAVYGMALEGMQGLGGVRAPEFADAAANALGVISAFAAVGLAERLQARRPA